MSAVAKLHLFGLGSGGTSEQLVTEADAEHGSFPIPEHGLEVFDSFGQD